MTRQLRFDLSSTEGEGARPTASKPLSLGHLARRLLYWTPVWLPLAFLLQLAWFGLRPVRADEVRLERAEVEVNERVRRLEQEREELELDRRKLDDEVYRERVRRSLVDPEVEPLTLEAAHTKER